MYTTPQLRPLGLGDILDGTFRLYRSNFVTFLGIVALLQVPIALLRLLLAVLLGNPLDQLDALQGLPGGPQLPGSDWLAIYSAYANSGLNSILNLLNGFVIQPLLMAAVVYVAARRLFELPTTLMEALKFGLRKLIYIVASNLLLSIGVSIALFLPFFCVIFLLFGVLIGAGASAASDSAGAMAAIGLIGGGISILLLFGLLLGVLWLYSQLAFYPQAIVVEMLGPVDALQRSWRLTRGHRWRTLGIYTLLYLLYVMLFLVVGGLLLVILIAIGVSLNNPLENYGLIVGFLELFQLLPTMLLQPFVLIGLTLMYYDLRVRREGLDMELQAQPGAPSLTLSTDQ